jgi:CXXC motif containing zinc binding protein, eukaryotic
VLKAALQEERDVSGGKGNTAHFVWRCGFCRRESSAKFESASPVQAYTAESSGKLAPFVVLDCRGLEFTGFEPRVHGFYSV